MSDVCDGKSDILLQDASTGMLGFWEMNGLNVAQAAAFPTSLSWKAIGIGDINGDGKSDVLLQDKFSGLVGDWVMNGLTIAGAQAVAMDPSWQVISASSATSSHVTADLPDTVVGFGDSASAASVAETVPASDFIEPPPGAISANTLLAASDPSAFIDLPRQFVGAGG